ncbi:MAG: polysaccharide biosynthesis protein [Terracidiphilus sp.]|jgi:UDP-glucose 4-epimerase
MPLTDKRILITGGTGSLGKAIVSRLLTGEMGKPARIIVFSRDETKQHYMRLDFQRREVATDEVIYKSSRQLLSFRIGDVRDPHSLAEALADVDVVVHAAAMKQVPACEYFPCEAVSTNVLGAQNIVRIIRQNRLPISTVLGVSTDKACKPINVYGMTKALLERILIEGNMGCPDTRFLCVRYGNVIASRGSVIPLFASQIESGGPVTITTMDMTRFLLPLDRAVDTIFAAFRFGRKGEIYVPKVPAAKIVDVADVMIAERDIRVIVTGIRPGEKVHEILVSEEECHRTIERDGYYVILPVLPELRESVESHPALETEYSSAHPNVDPLTLTNLLAPYVGISDQAMSEAA